MNIDQLRMVLALAKSGSMTATARELEVTQPALTYQINKIEAELGFHIFDRKRSGTSLTLEGDFFCSALWRVLATYDEAVGMARVLAYDEAVQRAKRAARAEGRDELSEHARKQASLNQTAVIGSVQGDVHEFGKNLVRTMLQIQGIDVTDLGTDVSPIAFLDHLHAHPECRVVLLSASRDKVLPTMADTITAIREAGLRDDLYVMVGGAAVDPQVAEQVGADAYTPDASEAARIAFEALSQQPGA